ncbi:MAG: peptidoglycan-binding protein [Candidatus Sericytochromatia bacterium]|nr:peptidoglycan-binding protein [Candidatus Sericytochromatia bacterium]
MSGVSNSSLSGAAYPSRPLPDERYDLPAVDAPRRRPVDEAGPVYGREPEGRGLFGHIADVFVGGGEAIWDMAKGVGTMIAHPIQTLKGIGYAITHPAALIGAFVDPYTSAIKEGRPGKALGRGIVEIGSFFIGGGAASGGAKGVGAATKGAATTTNAVVKGAAAAEKTATVAGKLSYGARLTRGVDKVLSKAKLLQDAAAAAKASGASANAAKLSAQAVKLTEYAGVLKKAAKVAAAGDTAAIAAARASVQAGMKTAGMSAAFKASSALQGASQGASRLAAGAAKVASGADKAADAGRLAAHLAQKPVMTGAAKAALKNAGVGQAAGSAGLAAAHQAYWQARAAGKTVPAAKAAAAAKAADVLGLAKDAAAVRKVVDSARLAGAAADASKWFTRANYVERPLVNGARFVGRGVDRGIAGTVKVGTYVGNGVSSAAGRVGNAIGRIGQMTLKDLILAPVRLPGKVISSAGEVLRGAAAALRGANLGQIVTAPVRAIGRGLTAVGAMTVGELIQSAVKLPGTLASAALATPASLFVPALGVAGLVNRVGQGTLGEVRRDYDDIYVDRPESGQEAGDGAPLSEDRVKAVAERYGLLPTSRNVEAFVREIRSYEQDSIGPDTGTPEQVRQLQTVLRAYGYNVEPSGTFDDATAESVIDFKQRHGITQSYRLADGKPAVNEYVDDRTAALLVEAMKAGERAGQPVKVKADPILEEPAIVDPGDEPAATDKPAPADAPAATDKPAPADAPAATDKPAPADAPAATDKPAPADAPAATDKPAPADAPAATDKPGDSTAAAVPTYAVSSQDRQAGLSGIAQRYLGSASRWREIYDLNKDVIGANANMIHVGQTLKMPADAKGLPGQMVQPPAAVGAGAPAKPAPSAAAVAPAKPSPTVASPAPSAQPASSGPTSQPATGVSSAPSAAASPSTALSQEQVAQYAKQYGLAAERANVEAFINEVASYPNGAVGPDAGDAETVRSLQLVLGKLGFKLEASGKFDDATAEAVIAFKQKEGLRQSYRLASGDYAINEYVDEATASRMAELLAAAK